jgi:predicted DsbA family dithiol-disulfide isomerase
MNTNTTDTPASNAAHTTAPAATTAPQLTIEIYSDLICPWCHIGRARLQRGLAQAGVAGTARVRWLPFQLNPDLPAAGLERRAYRTRKFGSWARSQELDRGVVAAGREEGLAFDYDRVLVTPNTLLGHRLLWWAAARGDLQDALAVALFRAYFEHGRDIGRADVLAVIAGETGLPAAEAAAFLAGDGGLAEVRAEEAAGRARGLAGVPFFIVNGVPAFSGAQPGEAFADIFRAALGPAAARCGPDACET